MGFRFRKETYIYQGPVMSSGKCVDKHWTGYTRAVSSKKAKSNLKFRYKMTHGLTTKAKIDLPGEILLATDE